jgi:hypothetical protein
MSGTFWIGEDKGHPKTTAYAKAQAVDTSNEAREQILQAIGKDAKSAPGSMLAPIAVARLKKFNFADAVVRDAAEVLRLAKLAGTGKGAVLRWL